MSKKKINVLFNREEKVLEIDLQENNTYESFLKKINEEFNRTNTYQLMAMNSVEQFAILNADNYIKILNEDIPEGLKLFMSEMVKTQDTLNSNTIEKNKPEPPNEEDDEDFEIDNNIQIEEEKDKINDNEIKKEENNNEAEEKKEDDKNENENNDNYNENFKSVVLSGEIKLNNNQNNLDKKIEFFDEKKTEDSNELVKSKYILSSPLIKPDMFKKEKCIICNTPLQGIKYICCLCDNYIICEECELYHNHPCFKYKIDFISDILETSNFIEKCYNFRLPHESTRFSKLYRKEYDLKIMPMTDVSFCLRPNKKINIPIKILNYSRDIVNSTQFVIICKNQKNIYLSVDENDKYHIEAGGEHILKIKCMTPERTCKQENIFIEIYSNDLDIKMSSRLSHEYKIEVNFDTDDDKINLDLKNDDYIFCFNKEHKRKALKLLKETNNEYKIRDIFKSLFENNWDQNKAIKALKKKKQ